MKTPKAKKLPSGAWHIYLRLGGKSVPVTARTKNECEVEARQIKVDYLAGVRDTKYFSPDITLRQAITKYINSRDLVLSPATVRGYDTIERNRFKGYMDKKVADIDWQKAINDESKSVSAKTIENAWGLVKSALKYAKCDYPKPNDLTMPQVVAYESEWLEPEHLSAFIKALEGDKYEIRILLELHGLRRSEAMAVDIGRIDLAKGLITVKGAIVPNRDHKHVKKETNKNRNSARVVPIMVPRLAELIADLKKRGEGIIECNPNALMPHVKKVCIKAGVPVVGNHGLRHSFASLCYHQGLSERETMDLGGWSDAVIMRKYIFTCRKETNKMLQKSSSVSFPASGT